MRRGGKLGRTHRADHEAGMPSPLIASLRQAMRVRHYSYRTERTYVAWVKRYIRFHGMRHPEELRIPTKMTGHSGRT